MMDFNVPGLLELHTSFLCLCLHSECSGSRVSVALTSAQVNVLTMSEIDSLCRKNKQDQHLYVRDGRVPLS